MREFPDHSHNRARLRTSYEETRVIHLNMFIIQLQHSRIVKIFRGARVERRNKKQKWSPHDTSSAVECDKTFYLLYYFLYFKLLFFSPALYACTWIHMTTIFLFVFVARCFTSLLSFNDAIHTKIPDDYRSRTKKLNFIIIASRAFVILASASKRTRGAKIRSFEKWLFNVNGY